MFNISTIHSSTRKKRKSLTIKNIRNKSKNLTSKIKNNKNESITSKSKGNKCKSVIYRNIRYKSKSISIIKTQKKNGIKNNPIKKPKFINNDKDKRRRKDKNIKPKTDRCQKSSTRLTFINSDIKYITNNSTNLKKKEEKEENEDLNELPFKLAINKDKRNAFKMFISIIIQKLEFINIFLGGGKMKIILICQYILSLLINFFFNSLLYSDEVVSNKYHNNGKLDLIVTLFVTLLSNIITSIFLYFVNCSSEIEERLEEMIKVKIFRNDEIIYLNRFFRYLKIKFFIFFIKQIIIIAICFYYIVIFCIIYSYSKISLLFNYFSSLLEGLLTTLAITIIIVITRKIGIVYSARYIYNTSKYINDRF